MVSYAIVLLCVIAVLSTVFVILLGTSEKLRASLQRLTGEPAAPGVSHHRRLCTADPVLDLCLVAALRILIPADGGGEGGEWVFI